MKGTSLDTGRGLDRGPSAKVARRAGGAELDLEARSKHHHPVRRRLNNNWQGYLGGIAAAAAVTALSSFGMRYLELADILMFYMLGVVVIATRLGIGPSVVSAFVGATAFDFFVIPPVFEFTVTEMRHFITLGGLVAVSAIVSGLTERLRLERARALSSEQWTSTLYALERDLAGVRQLDQLALVADAHLGPIAGAAPTLFIANKEQTLTVMVPPGAPSETPWGDATVARQVITSARPIWLDHDAHGGGYVPLLGPDRVVGVVAIQPNRAGSFGLRERELLEACARQVANAVDRLAMASEAETAHLEAETERVRNALLSSVSHDFRTPLATISASAQMLVRSHVQMNAGLRGEMLVGIAEQADRLDDLLRNLLAMTRVEAGELSLRMVPGAVEEVVAAAVRRCSRTLAGREIEVRAPRGLPLAAMDASLLEQVFVNLLENAARYSPAAAPISIVMRDAGRTVAVDVEDHGTGVPEDEVEKVFEKFYRGRHAPRGDGGVGLGLAICRAIVVAHGGGIVLENGPAGGALVRVTLPAVGLSPSEVAARLPELS